jgi:hypothetical protein
VARAEVVHLLTTPPRPIVPPELTRGPFTLREAQQAGLSWDQLQGASWRRVGHGLYAWSGLSESPALSLTAIRRRLPSAVVSGRTAAWLHVVDLGSRAPLVEAVVAVDMALHGRLAGLAQLRQYAEVHPGWRGIAHLRRVIDLAEPATESPMETRLRLLLVLAGLPRPQAQVALHDERGRFLARTDLYYPAERLGLEYDGSSHRNSLVENNRRQNRLQDAGFRLLRFTAADINRTPDAVVALVARQLRCAHR